MVVKTGRADREITDHHEGKPKIPDFSNFS